MGTVTTKGTTMATIESSEFYAKRIELTMRDGQPVTMLLVDFEGNTLDLLQPRIEQLPDGSTRIEAKLPPNLMEVDDDDDGEGDLMAFR